MQQIIIIIQFFSMQEYACRFATVLKENCKRLSKWGVHYFTKNKSLYPLHIGCISFNDLPKLINRPSVSISKNEERRLEEFAIKILKDNDTLEMDCRNQHILIPSCFYFGHFIFCLFNEVQSKLNKMIFEG